ncbi:uncharacterized protein F4807DRAFT_420893 [Annulohypoxylon truncatum]|uniref:uncharacterized protein n=1 Tax=Annulohypoxylon truncatum TaxID=327061 RepID=UPI0020076081|nr:uncharacterized protein F4807DRAFT_420893 [Annulohypoxylon truncatum]KAI1210934.1 hypothetical protein F4807DRAFT_420893 [Annulohypoxylon truncatum]
MHLASFASLLAISANVVLTNADATNPSVSLARADNPAVPLLRSGFSERRAAMMDLQPRAGIQDQCNAATGFFSTARCVLRRGVIKAGPAVSYGTQTLNQVVTDIWRKITTTTATSGMLTSSEYENGNLYIYATTGYPGAPGTCSWPSLNQGVPTYDLYVALMQAVLDAQSNGGVNRYYLTSATGEIYASLMVKAS